MRSLGQQDYSKHKEFIISTLDKVDFFTPLTPEQLAEVAGFVKFVEFDAGEVVFSKDDPGDSFYLIFEGRVQASVPGLFGEKVLSEMGSGDFFGELALILNQPRSASITCLENTRCFRLDTSDFSMLMERNPFIASIVKEAASRRFNSGR